MLLGDLIYRVGADIKGFDTEMSKVSKSLLKVDKESQKSLAGFDRIGQRLTEVGTSLTVGITLPLVALGAGSLKMAGDFEGAMNRVSALGDITGQDLDLLRQQAMKLGADTQFSALQAAEGMSMLAAAGQSTTEIMALMPAVLNLAAAGQMSVADSAKITSDTLGQFQMSATESGRAVDVLAAASMEGKSTMNELGNTLAYVGPSAHGAGQSLEETTAAIVALDIAGIRGERAGTGLRGVLGSLIAPSREAATHMRDLGVSISDSEGKILPLSNIMEQFRSKLANVGSEAERQRIIFEVFGREAGAAAQVLIQTGGPALDAMEQKFINSGGAAEQAAQRINQGFAYAMEQMKGSIETAGIALGQVLIPLVNKALGAFTAFINDAILPTIQFFKDLPGPVQAVALGLIGLFAAIGPVTLATGLLMKAIVDVHTGYGLLIKVIPVLATKYATMKAALVATESATVALSVATVALQAALGAGLIYAVYKLVTAYQDLRAAKEDLKSAERQETDALLKLGNRYKEMGGDLDKLHDAYMHGANAGKSWSEVLNTAVRALSATKAPIGDAKTGVVALGDAHAGAKKKVVEFDTAYAEYLGKLQDSATSYAIAAAEMELFWDQFDSGVFSVEAENFLQDMEAIRVAAEGLSRTELPGWITGGVDLQFPVIAPEAEKEWDGIKALSEQTYERMHADGNRFREKEKGGWADFGKQVSTIVTDLGKGLADLVMGLFSGDEANEGIRKQQADLRAALAEQDLEWVAYGEEVVSTLETLREGHAAGLAAQEADLVRALDEKRVDYEDYAAEVATSIEEITTKHADALAKESAQLQDSLADRIADYTEYVEDVQRRIDDLTKRFDRQTEDAEKRRARETADYEEAL
ncbi:MAG: phage tail tape measure protein, partial [Armatimonadetes bacterium RBG_16_58_9]